MSEVLVERLGDVFVDGGNARLCANIVREELGLHLKAQQLLL